MSTLDVVAHGFAQVEAKIRAEEARIQSNHVKAGKAAANALKVVMRREAPYETKRDVARNKGRVRHLRATIRVRPVLGGWAVGPASPLAHLVVRGAHRGQTERVGGGGGAAHQMTLAGARQFRAHARKLIGPVGQAQALAISSGGETYYRASAKPGPMPANAFIRRTRELAGLEAKRIAGEVLFHNLPDPNEA